MAVKHLKSKYKNNCENAVQQIRARNRNRERGYSEQAEY